MLSVYGGSQNLMLTVGIAALVWAVTKPIFRSVTIPTKNPVLVFGEPFAFDLVIDSNVPSDIDSVPATTTVFMLNR